MNSFIKEADMIEEFDYLAPKTKIKPNKPWDATGDNVRC
jgi:hypothetical protein